MVSPGEHTKLTHRDRNPDTLIDMLIKTDVPHFDFSKEKKKSMLHFFRFFLAVHTPRVQTKCFVAWVMVLYNSMTNAVTQSAISKW